MSLNGFLPQMLEKPPPYIYFLADSSCHNLLDLVTSALLGGANIIQLRVSETEVTAKKALALRLKNVCAKHSALFLINDHVIFSSEIQADGVHLGQGDMPVDAARQLLGNSAVIGLTLHTKAQVKKAPYADLDYVSIGCLFPSRTKPDLSPLGLERAMELVTEIRKRHHSIPIFCIGGITVSTIRQLSAIKPNGVVLFAGLARSVNPQQTIRRLRDEMLSW